MNKRRVQQLPLSFDGKPPPIVYNGDDILYAYLEVEDHKRVARVSTKVYPLEGYPQGPIDERWQGKKRILIRLQDGTATFLRPAWKQRDSPIN